MGSSLKLTKIIFCLLQYLFVCYFRFLHSHNILVEKENDDVLDSLFDLYLINKAILKNNNWHAYKNKNYILQYLLHKHTEKNLHYCILQGNIVQIHQLLLLVKKKRQE